MQTFIRCLFATTLVVLLWNALCGLSLHSAEDSQDVSSKPTFSTPVDVRSTADFHAKYSDGTLWDQEIKVRYQWDGETAYATETIRDRNTPNTETLLRSDFMYRGGELIRFHSDITGTTTEHFMAVFVSPKVGASQRRIMPGEIFDACPSGFAVAGCFDGYFYDDYFSGGVATSTEQLGDAIHVTGQSKYGNAEAWLDSKNGFLPQRVLIERRVGRRGATASLQMVSESSVGRSGGEWPRR